MSRETPRRLRLAAMLASIVLAGSNTTFAQLDLSDVPTVPTTIARQSGVIVSLRPQSIGQPLNTIDKDAKEQSKSKVSESQEGNKAENAAKEKGGENDKDQSKPEDPTAPKDGKGKDDEVKSATGSGVGTAGEAGRLSPIVMESVRTPIGAANISVDDIGTKILPDDQAARQASGMMPLPSGLDRSLQGLTYRWQAANICHLPLYFEEPMLERHGQQRCPTWIQPAVSGGKFLGNVVMYPYKATLQPAFENRYTLGHFRPGSGAPALRETLPWSADAALVQAGAFTGVFVGLPW